MSRTLCEVYAPFIETPALVAARCLLTKCNCVYTDNSHPVTFWLDDKEAKGEL